MSLRIITNYTQKSHVLCGSSLKDTYADFRVKILREAEWATWHPRLKVPDGKGWCIRQKNLVDLETELKNAAIPYDLVEHIPLSPKPELKPKKKLGPSAYNLFTKEMWANREEMISVIGQDIKNPGLVSKYIAQKWKNVNIGHTKWHALAEQLRAGETSYEEKWTRWQGDRTITKRGFEMELFGDYTRFLVFEPDSDDLTITIRSPPGTQREEIFKKAWEFYSSRTNLSYIL